jgi:adenylate cyclase
MLEDGAGGKSVSYEVYLQVGGRWELHARHGSHAREEAIDEARQLETESRVEATCVNRESYDAVANSSTESVVYRTPKQKKPLSDSGRGRNDKSSRKASRGGGGGGGDAALPTWMEDDLGAEIDPELQKRSKKKRRKKRRKSSETKKAAGKAVTMMQALPRLFFIFLISCLGGGLVLYVALYSLSFIGEQGIIIGRGTAQSILIGSFVVGFLMFCVPMLRRYVPDITGRGRPQQQQVAQTVAVSPQPAPTPPLPEPDSFPTPEPEPEPEPDWPTVDDDPPEEPMEWDEETEAEPQVAEAVAVPEFNSPEETDAGETMLKFIRDALMPVAESGRAIDAFNRFGLTLYVAGAGEFLSSQFGLNRDRMVDVLSKNVAILGQSEKMARAFCSNIDEYLLNPKYLQMYEVGREAMVLGMRNPGGDLGLVGTLDDWNKPASASGPSKEFVAVLFTDIVGSTAMTQERGDDGAQEVVRAHNSIVRESLAMHKGREIKHTGDGIMASFPVITKAVEGAIAIQEGVALHNQVNPHQNFGICIGINAGEPIHEDGDIFGTPVQLAARVLSIAEGSEITASTIVRELCSGKDYQFSKKGDYDLKGFEQPVPIYLIGWSGSGA